MHGNGLMLNVRFSTEAGYTILYGFCIGLPVQQVGGLARVSPRVVRAVYDAIRYELSEPQFAIWHRMTTTSVFDAMPFDLYNGTLAAPIAECYFSRFCQRNYSLGNRHSRLCRKCPLPKELRAMLSEEDQDRTTAWTEMIVRECDSARAFYAKLGIREKPAVSVPFLQVMHFRTVATALEASRQRDGMIDFESDRPLTTRTLYKRMADHLEWFRLTVR